MKKLLTVLLAVSLLGCFHHNCVMAQELASNNIAYFGANYEGNYGLFGGVGLSLGKVSAMPYTRIALERANTGEYEFEKSLGVEIAYFAYEYGGWRFGLLANVADINWLQNQEQEIGVYLGQTAGVIVTKYVSSNIGVAAWGKVKAQLFDADTQFRDRFTAGLAIYGKI